MGCIEGSGWTERNYWGLDCRPVLHNTLVEKL